MSMDVTLNNGVEMPALGFGVFQTPPDVTAASVAEALRVGYRLIDTAASYFNEREVGEGIRRSGLDRSEVFIETKVWISDYGYHQTLHAFDKSADKLGVEQIDLLLLHQPVPTPVRQHRRRLPRPGEAPGRGSRSRDRRQQLHARCPRSASRPL
jgi:diketogulonate reductase-like aldo/keto reductase